MRLENFLVVQWLELCALAAEGINFDLWSGFMTRPGQGPKIPQAVAEPRKNKQTVGNNIPLRVAVIIK